MREKASVVCTIIFIVCMTMPVAAGLPGSYSTEKNISVSINSGDMNWQNAVLEKNTLSAGGKKLSSALLAQASASGLAADTVVRNSSDYSLRIKNVPVISGSGAKQGAYGNLPSGKLAYVYVYVKPGYSTHIIDSSVYEVENRDENYHIAVAWVDVQALETLASLEGVRTIREVTPPVVNTGSVTTAGDTIHKTANVRSTYGNRGAGMKIGIISDGVDNLTSAVACGDLPADVTVLRNTHGGDEGTAMLEIVHDMAPDAKLYFHDPGANNLAFNAAIDALIASGCTVICDDISWTTEPSFEDGIVASHIRAVLAGNNIIYISSAGNAAQKHYQGNYYKDGTSNWTDFSQGTTPGAKGLYVNLSTGSRVIVILHWNDQWAHSGNDYDLFLHNMNGSIITYSYATQSGSGDPIEGFSYINTGPMKDAIINVWNYNNAQTKNLELFIFTMNGAWVYPNNINSTDSIYGHPAVPDVISVAAVPASSPATIESFSSRGPVTISYPSPETRNKPDISGADGVAVTGAGGFSNPFYGTSASAPHIAAIVAQYWGAHPALTPAQVRTALYTNAADLGSSGKDTAFGYGLADALTMESHFSTVSNTAVVEKTFHFGTSGDIPVSGDWNGDGTEDTGVFRPSNGNWYLDTTKSGIVNRTFHFGTTGDTPVTGDWNSDGIADIGVYRNSNGNWYLDTTKTGVVNQTFRFGKDGDTPVTGDWNSDGISDIGIFRNSNGNWYLDTTKTGVVNQTFRFGKDGDTTIIGDWNGDGTEDAGVFRPSNGNWYLDTTKSGIVNRTFLFGKNGDTPVIGDWNSDGISDIGVFRNSNGNWYLNYTPQI